MAFVGALLAFVLGSVFLALPLAVTLAVMIGVNFLIPPPFGQVIAASGAPSLLSIVLVHLVLVVVAYLVSFFNTPLGLGGGPVTPVFPWEQLGRGVMVGLNAAFNYALVTLYAAPIAALLTAAGLSTPGALFSFLPTALLVINMLTSLPFFSGNLYFQTVLAYAGVLMPMSWLGIALGGIAFGLQVISVVFGAGYRSWWFDRTTCTLVLNGGALFFGTTPWNSGNFTFIHSRMARTRPWADPSGTDTAGNPELNLWTGEGVQFHEAGHNLNNVAMGPWFGLMNMIDAFILTPLSGGVPRSGYGEQLAEGRLRETVAPWLPTWSWPVTLGAGVAGNVPPVVSGVVTVVAATPLIPVRLDASASIDPDLFPLGFVNPGVTPSLGFFWRFRSLPAGSNAVIVAPFAAATSFQPDIGGDYVVEVARRSSLRPIPASCHPCRRLSSCFGPLSRTLLVRARSLD